MLKKLCSAKQRYKETLIDYAIRVRNLVRAVSEGSTNDALVVSITNLKEQALHVFLEGINDKIKITVKSKNPFTVEQAIQLAIIEDKNITPTDAKPNNHNNYYFNNNKAAGETRKHNKGNCRVCGKHRHYARDCRFGKGSPKYEGKPSTSSLIRQIHIKCVGIVQKTVTLLIGVLKRKITINVKRIPSRETGVHHKNKCSHCGRRFTRNM